MKILKMTNEKNYIFVEVGENYDFENYIDVISNVHKFYEDEKINLILFDVTNVNDMYNEKKIEMKEFAKLKIGEFVVKKFKDEDVKIAAIAKEKKFFGEFIAQKEGLKIKIFLNKNEALNWLLKK